VENVREIPRLQQFCERLGLRPTYFVNYQVMAQRWAADVFGGIHRSGRAEVGGHVHPWNTPPCEDGGDRFGTMLCSYPADMQDALIRIVTEHIGSATGSAPTSFRAGRFGLNQMTVGFLAGLGYRVDSSVTPYFSWGGRGGGVGGQDFTNAPLGIYRIDESAPVTQSVAGGALIEVPISSGFTRLGPRSWRHLASLRRRDDLPSRAVLSVANRFGRVRRVLLSPEVATLSDMLALARGLVRERVSHVHLFFHGTSMRPGLTPFTRTAADVDRLLGRVEGFVEGLTALTSVKPMTVTEAALASAV